MCEFKKRKITSLPFAVSQSVENQFTYFHDVMYENDAVDLFLLWCDIGVIELSQETFYW